MAYISKMLRESALLHRKINFLSMDLRKQVAELLDLKNPGWIFVEEWERCMEIRERLQKIMIGLPAGEYCKETHAPFFDKMLEAQLSAMNIFENITKNQV